MSGLLSITGPVVTKLPVVVIGAGPVGLAAAAHLLENERDSSCCCAAPEPVLVGFPTGMWHGCSGEPDQDRGTPPFHRSQLACSRPAVRIDGTEQLPAVLNLSAVVLDPSAALSPSAVVQRQSAPPDPPR